MMSNIASPNSAGDAPVLKSTALAMSFKADCAAWFTLAALPVASLPERRPADPSFSAKTARLDACPV